MVKSGPAMGRNSCRKINLKTGGILPTTERDIKRTEEYKRETRESLESVTSTLDKLAAEADRLQEQIESMKKDIEAETNVEKVGPNAYSWKKQ
jgi:chromosome segregation ATPase